MLKFQLDTLDGVDESVKTMYTEKEGKFFLAVDGLPQQEDVTGLKSKVEELLGEKKAAEAARKQAEAEALKAHEEALKKSGDVEGLEKSWSTKFSAREAELTAQLENQTASLQGQIRDLTVGRTATEIATTLAVPGTAKALLPHIERRLGVEMREGKPTVVVLDQSGKLSAATLDELKAEFTSDPAFGPLIAGSRASGGGAEGHKHGGGAAKGNFGGTEKERTDAIRARFPELSQQ